MAINRYWREKGTRIMITTAIVLLSIFVYYADDIDNFFYSKVYEAFKSSL